VALAYDTAVVYDAANLTDGLSLGGGLDLSALLATPLRVLLSDPLPGETEPRGYLTGPGLGEQRTWWL
jgi:hypothetical protein